jgi:hypothetical protein
MRFEASKNFIVAVLNEAIMHGRNRITIRADLLGMDILKIDLEDERITWVADRKDFDPVVSDLRMKIGERWLEDDLPDYYDLRDAFQSSLIVRPLEFDNLIDELGEIEERRLDPYRHPKQMLLAIDTNIAYNRLLSRMTLLEEMCGGRGMDPSKIPVIIPSLVEEEISRSIGQKYSSGDIGRMERALGARLPCNLSNCLCRRGRRAANAQAEIKIIEERYSSIMISGGEFNEDKEKRDWDIVRSVSDYSRDHDNQVLFLTADDKAMAHCNAFKVPSKSVKYEYDLPRKMEYDPWLLVELLYDISINFAVISLRGLGVRIQGTWAGKSIRDYPKERLCFCIEGSSKLSRDLKRDHDILCALGQAVDLKHIY